MSIFSVTLQKLRENKCYTRRDLAERAGISETTVMLYETEYIEPREEDLESIATVFDVSVNFLIGRANSLLSEPVSIDIAGREGVWDGVLREREALGKVIIPKPKKREHGRIFAIEVGTNDMLGARIKKGDIVIFEAKAEYKKGDIVAVRMPDGCVYIRRFFEHEGLVALSTERLPSYDNTDTYEVGNTSYKILGKAIECRISF